MLKRECLCLVAIVFLLAFGSVASGAVLFSDDLEGDAVGAAPGKFEMYSHPHNGGSFSMEVAEDPAGESGKVIHTFGYALWVPKAAGRENWSDFICEWDWMWANTGEYPGTAFRITGENYYHFSPRADNVNLGFWYYDGGWNQVGDLVQYDFGTNIWNRYQVIMEVDQLSLKVKRRDDPTPFADIDPLIAVTDGNLVSGPISICGSDTDAWVDNVVVAESEEDILTAVEPGSKLSITWGSIKR